MSYTHLAGRLIETQRSMLGESAIDVARSTEGITVSDDGTVETIEGDQRAVIGELAQRYTSLLGDAAEQRLLAAASEFEDELTLPAALGGPEAAPAEEEPTARPDTTVDTTADAAVSDGGTIASESATEQSPSAADHAETARATGAGDETHSATDAPAAVSESMVVAYTTASSITSLETDLADVYLMPAADDGWQAPVTVPDAFADAVVAATGLDESAFGPVESYVDSERLLRTLAGDGPETVCVDVEGVNVTFHRSGSLAVH